MPVPTVGQGTYQQSGAGSSSLTPGDWHTTQLSDKRLWGQPVMTVSVCMDTGLFWVVCLATHGERGENLSIQVMFVIDDKTQVRLNTEHPYQNEGEVKNALM